MQDVILALRNIGRNRRRSLVTILAVALSCGGLALFGGYVSWAFRGVEEQTVGLYGHIQIYKKGYYANGGGDLASYALSNYEEIKTMLERDPFIGPRLELVTAQIIFNGMVTSARTHTSTTFFGLGVFPSDDERLWQWNPYALFPAKDLAINASLFGGPPELADGDLVGGSMGTGLGRILHLDRSSAKTDRPRDSSASPEVSSPASAEVDLPFLMEQAETTSEEEGGRATVELVSMPPDGGVPNVVTLGVRKLMPRATKEFDDQLIKLHIRHASALLFPGQPLHVSTVIVLLKKTADTTAVAQRLQRLFDEKNLDLEMKTWTEIRPFYNQIRRMLGIIFVFVFILLAMLVVFTIYNTQNAGIIERMSELGTLRALGVNRWGLWKILILEGFFLGLIGGIAGVLLGVAGDLALRAMEVVYTPPGVSFFARVEVLVLRNPAVLIVAFTGSLLCALISSAFPARRAALTPIVEALRHT
ncbi:MAG TPA: FtsX-like permease family protein [Chthoniobacterales bacterium]|nr:FtsX-like permease family protein [Chthoniobacterales bacterium]